MDRHGSLLTVAGWGNTSGGAAAHLPAVLQSVKVPVVSRWERQFAYPDDWDGSMMCASAGGRDACQGDSGG
ncbi:trypsin-like serine protease [Stenotrophomonas tumulicola]|uniref:trypsin-like serine protease n=1 Tax=Stenotrophomonas tumulicola TaxID=1685415 RepID=UPI003CCCAB4F